MNVTMSTRHPSLLILVLLQSNFLFFTAISIAVVKSFTITNNNIVSFPNIQYSHKSTMMMMMMMQNEEIVLYDYPAKTSLASSYVIYSQDGQSKYEQTTWTLMPLDLMTQQATEKVGVGSLAIKALKSSMDFHKDYSNTLKLICNFVKHGDDEETLDVTVENYVQTSRIATGESQESLNFLLATLSRVMIQKKARDSGILSSTSSTSSLSVRIPSILSGTNVTEILILSDLLSSNGCNPSLYKSLLPPDVNLSTLEMSDMVDSCGNVLGSLPRLLVHKLNILHRGVGIVVCKGKHITCNNDSTKNIEIYCHKRTETKRIFPNLYDMFVGGVSTSGENSKLTASREVGEELGLTKAFEIINKSSFNCDNAHYSSPLSDPLFKCTVCTSYNRCLVTVFTYKYLSNQEEIKWQEEEVSWGDFVPYHIVEKAASMSIDRLIKDGKWPGAGDDDDNKAFTSTTTVDIDSDQSIVNWHGWDFVPDGLLVWVAWLKWINQNEDKKFS